MYTKLDGKEKFPLSIVNTQAGKTNIYYEGSVVSIHQAHVDRNYYKVIMTLGGLVRQSKLFGKMTK